VGWTLTPDDRAKRFIIVAEGFLDGIAVWILDHRITHIVVIRSMAARRAFLVDCAQAAHGFLPPIMHLPRDGATGQLIVPSSRVTDLYDARENWHKLVDRSMDATTIAIVNGRLIMPLQSWPTTGLHGSIHPSWENDAAAQAALGPTLANWLYSGKLEYVAP
jgi:hypothetical protein